MEDKRRVEVTNIEDVGGMPNTKENADARLDDSGAREDSMGMRDDKEMSGDRIGNTHWV